MTCPTAPFLLTPLIPLRGSIGPRRWHRSGAGEAALEANSKASSLDPSRIQLLIQRARIMLYTGQPTEAVAWVDKALALQTQSNPLLVDALLQLCRANQALGRYDEAIDACENSRDRRLVAWSSLPRRSLRPEG
jgi:tetratricopeptide (TPR) repeat protein